MKRVCEEKTSTVQAKPGFPRMRASPSARQSFEMELARLRGMSIEDRITEALSLKDRFSWLEPVLKET